MLAEIQGKIERISYANRADGHTIARLTVAGNLTASRHRV
jgi:hypothetical protein